MEQSFHWSEVKLPPRGVKLHPDMFTAEGYSIPGYWNIKGQGKHKRDQCFGTVTFDIAYAANYLANELGDILLNVEWNKVLTTISAAKKVAKNRAQTDLGKS